MKPLSQARLRELFHYCPETGHLTRLITITKNAKAGDRAGTPMAHNHMMLSIDGGKYLVHRVIWLHVYGVWPDGLIDHIDGDPLNNRLANLRLANHAVNSQNQRRPHRENKSGFLGVIKSRNRWRAQISIRNKNKIIGTFATPEEAHQAYVEAKRIHHEGNTL